MPKKAHSSLCPKCISCFDDTDQLLISSLFCIELSRCIHLESSFFTSLCLYRTGWYHVRHFVNVCYLLPILLKKTLILYIVPFIKKKKKTEHLVLFFGFLCENYSRSIDLFAHEYIIFVGQHVVYEAVSEENT